MAFLSPIIIPPDVDHTPWADKHPWVKRESTWVGMGCAVITTIAITAIIVCNTDTNLISYATALPVTITSSVITGIALIILGGIGVSRGLENAPRSNPEVEKSEENPITKNIITALNDTHQKARMLEEFKAGLHKNVGFTLTTYSHICMALAKEKTEEGKGQYLSAKQSLDEVIYTSIQAEQKLKDYFQNGNFLLSLVYVLEVFLKKSDFSNVDWALLTLYEKKHKIPEMWFYLNRCKDELIKYFLEVNDSKSALKILSFIDSLFLENEILNGFKPSDALQNYQGRKIYKKLLEIASKENDHALIVFCNRIKKIDEIIKDEIVLLEYKRLLLESFLLEIEEYDSKDVVKDEESKILDPRFIELVLQVSVEEATKYKEFIYEILSKLPEEKSIKIFSKLFSLLVQDSEEYSQKISFVTILMERLNFKNNIVFLNEISLEIFKLFELGNFNAIEYFKVLGKEDKLRSYIESISIHQYGLFNKLFSTILNKFTNWSYLKACFEWIEKKDAVGLVKPFHKGLYNFLSPPKDIECTTVYIGESLTYTVPKTFLKLLIPKLMKEQKLNEPIKISISEMFSSVLAYELGFRSDFDKRLGNNESAWWEFYITGHRIGNQRIVNTSLKNILNDQFNISSFKLLYKYLVNLKGQQLRVISNMLIKQILKLLELQPGKKLKFGKKPSDLDVSEEVGPLPLQILCLRSILLDKNKVIFSRLYLKDILPNEFKVNQKVNFSIDSNLIKQLCILFPEVEVIDLYNCKLVDRIYKIPITLKIFVSEVKELAPQFAEVEGNKERVLRKLSTKSAEEFIVPRYDKVGFERVLEEDIGSCSNVTQLSIVEQKPEWYYKYFPKSSYSYANYQENGSPTEDQFIRFLTKFKSLTSIDVFEMPISQISLNYISQNFHNLNSFKIVATAKQRPTLEELLHFIGSRKNWKCIGLRKMELKDEDLGKICPLIQAVEELDLGSNPISSGGILYLETLRKLKILKIDRTGCTKFEVISLIKKLPGLERIEVSRSLKGLKKNSALLDIKVVVVDSLD